VSAGQGLGVGYLILPRYTQDTTNASQVEDVESSLVSGICGPCLAAVKKCADDAGIVHCHLPPRGQPAVCPHSGREACKCCSRLPDPLVNLGVQVEVVGDSGDKLGKLTNDVEFVVVDGNDRRCCCILS